MIIGDLLFFDIQENSYAFTPQKVYFLCTQSLIIIWNLFSFSVLLWRFLIPKIHKNEY